MSKIKSIILSGKSGRQYSFELYTVETNFNAVGAVYFFSQDQVNIKPIYIGQTKNLSERFDNHHQWPCISRNGAKYIGIHSESLESSRLQKEDDLIKNYNPICNK